MTARYNNTQPCQQENTSVSVIIPTYGRPARLQRLLAQLLDQNPDTPSYEIIIVDDGSPEPVSPMVEACASQTSVPVRCLRQRNGGPALARNLGAEAARSEFLLFVDDDMLVRPDFIKGHIETQQEFGPGAVMCAFAWQLDLKPEPFRRWYERLIVTWNGCLPANLKPLCEGKVYEICDGMVTAAVLSIPRLDFESLGGFDLGYYTASCEDQDFGRRFIQKGGRAFLTYKTTTIHAESRSTLEQLCERTRRGAADTVRLVRRFAHLYPAEPPVAVVNGPLRLGVDPWRLVAKKLIKQLVTSRFVSPAMYGLVHLLERVFPETRLLSRVYDLLVGARFQQGWREGLKMHGAAMPLMGPEALKNWARLVEP